MSNKTDLRKKRILEAAFKHFRRYGYSKSISQDVAISARVSRASLYSYLKNKHDLFIALTQEPNNEHVKKSQVILKSGRPDGEKLREIIDAWIIIPYTRIIRTPSANGWLNEPRDISTHTETRFRESFIESITSLVGRDSAQVIVLAIRGQMDDRPPGPVLKKAYRYSYQIFHPQFWPREPERTAEAPIAPALMAPPSPAKVVLILVATGFLIIDIIVISPYPDCRIRAARIVIIWHARPLDQFLNAVIPVRPRARVQNHPSPLS